MHNSSRGAQRRGAHLEQSWQSCFKYAAPCRFAMHTRRFYYLLSFIIIYYSWIDTVVGRAIALCTGEVE